MIDLKIEHPDTGKLMFNLSLVKDKYGFHQLMVTDDWDTVVAYLKIDSIKKIHKELGDYIAEIENTYET